MLKKIISGGQTGADRAALDFAIKQKIPHGGWVPKGRLAEDGPLPKKYKLTEMPTDSYQERTEQNVIDSDGTVIISHGKLTGGSAYTQKMAKKHGRPCLHVDLNKLDVLPAALEILTWLDEHGHQGPECGRSESIEGSKDLQVGEGNSGEPVDFERKRKHIFSSLRFSKTPPDKRHQEARDRR